MPSLKVRIVADHDQRRRDGLVPQVRTALLVHRQGHGKGERVGDCIAEAEAVAGEIHSMRPHVLAHAEVQLRQRAGHDLIRLAHIERRDRSRVAVT